MTEATGILEWLRSMERAYEAEIAAGNDDDVAQALSDNYGEAAAEITRLQSELNTALERVRYADQQLHYALDAKDWKLVEEARAVLQSEGGK